MSLPKKIIGKSATSIERSQLVFRSNNDTHTKRTRSFFALKNCTFEKWRVREIEEKLHCKLTDLSLNLRLGIVQTTERRERDEMNKMWNDHILS